MMAKRRRLLLTGASGLLGAALVDSWAQRWDIIALVGRHRVAPARASNVPVDLAKPEGLAAVVASARPDAVVHCAAWTDLDGCEANPTLARILHRDATAALAQGAASLSVPFVYISTDSLFSAASGLHREEDAIDPRSIYAKTKREGEEVALAISPHALVLRTCIIGWNAQPKVSLAEWVLRELRAGRPVSAFTDVCFTPILTTTLVRAIERLVDMEARGILHVSGGECVTKHAFAEKVAEVFGLPKSLVVPSVIAGVKLRAPRPPAPCLDSSRYAALTGDTLQTVGEALEEMRRLEADGWRERLRSLLES